MFPQYIPELRNCLSTTSFSDASIRDGERKGEIRDLNQNRKIKQHNPTVSACHFPVGTRKVKTATNEEIFKIGHPAFSKYSKKLQNRSFN